MPEIIIPVGFTGYFVSDAGVIYTSRHRVGAPYPEKYRWELDGPLVALKPRPTKSGHLKVVLYIDGKPHNKYIHDLILTAFKGPRPTPKHECRHDDGVPSNNRPSNLLWGTKAQNYADRARHGSKLLVNFPCGESHPKAKLTEFLVVECRKQHAAGLSFKSIAATLGVSDVAIRMAVRRITWKHVP